MDEGSRLHRWGATVAGQPWRTLRNVLVLLVWVGLLAAFRGGEMIDGITVDGSDSARSAAVMEDWLGEYSGATARIVLTVDDGRIDDEARRPVVDALVTSLGKRTKVQRVLADPIPAQVSLDGKATFVDIRYDPGPPPDEVELESLTNAVAHLDAGVHGEVGGVLPEVASDPGGGNEAFGALAALAILVVVFGSLLAAGVTLGLAVASLGVGFAVIVIVARFADVPSMAPQLAAMIGLGVGIDYALLVVSRFRELAATQGLDDLPSVVGQTMATAGHSVLVAGVTVVVSITGLAVTGVGLLTMMGVATSICVLAAVLANLTVLPAVLALLGPRLTKQSRRSRRDSGSVWLRWSATARRRPVPALVGSLVVLVVLGVPALAMRLGYNDSSSADPSTTQRRAHDALVERFGPGYDTDLAVTVDLSHGPPGQRGPTTRTVAAQLATVAGVVRVFDPEFSRKGEASLIRFVPDADAQSPRIEELLGRLRSDVLVTATRGTGAEASVGGLTAVRNDFAQRVADRLALFVAVVVSASLIFLVVAFRAVVVAVKAALMNLLSIAAAYGVVVAVFQWGWGAGLLGVTTRSPIDVYVPVFLFAILFGLSMDYEVFLISRMREAWERGGDNDAAVAEGLATTARVVTSAATVMVAVFAGFVFGADIVTKMFGVGLTTAVVVDVTIVRMVLLPASMTLLGRINWWPTWNRRVEDSRSPAGLADEMA